ncbi:MAG: hypothetical protein ACRDV0_10755 [Acidimicrobiales bacterium]
MTKPKARSDLALLVGALQILSSVDYVFLDAIRDNEADDPRLRLLAAARLVQVSRAARNEIQKQLSVGPPMENSPLTPLLKKQQREEAKDIRALERLLQ